MVQTKLKEPCYQKEYISIGRRIHVLQMIERRNLTTTIPYVVNRRNKLMDELKGLLKKREDMRVEI